MRRWEYLFFAAVVLFGAGEITPGYGQERLTPELLWQLGRVSDPQVSPDGKWVVYGVTRYDIEENRGNTDLWLVPMEGGEARRLTDTPESEWGARWRPDGERIGYLSRESGSAQLWEINADGSGKRQVTNLEGGIANFLYSPTGNHISFTRQVKLDSTVSELHPDLPKAEALLIDDLMYRHWDTWHDGTYNHLFIAPYSDGSLAGDPLDLMPGEPFDTPLKPFGGTEEFAWSPDGRYIAYTCKKLHGTEYAVSTDSDVYLYSLHMGQTVNVSASNPGYDVEPRFSPDGNTLIWLSMETPGYESDRQRLMAYDLDTRQKRELSTGFEYNVYSPVWAPDGGSVYFITAKEATRQVYAFDPADGPGRISIRPVTSGIHDYTALEVSGTGDGYNLVAARMSMSMPTELFRIDPQTGRETQLTFTNRETWSRLALGKVEKRSVQTTDGRDMLVWVIYPPDFDPSKKYPVLLYCQGGPQVAVSQFFSYRWNFQLMAAHDYVIVAPNRRGLPGFGPDWNEEISGDWGGQAMRDLLAAIDDVARGPYVDRDRLGAVGASFGGYSVFWLAGNHEGRFKVFVSHAGVFHLESMYGATEEIFFVNHDLEGPYWKRPTPRSYREFSPHRFVARWDTPILIIHGERDFRVPVTESMQAFTAAQLRDVPSRFLYFPNENHWILSPQNSILWNRVFFDWLGRYLKTPAH